MKQLSLFKDKPRLEFGGVLGIGKRKAARPLDTKRPHHFVLKAKCANRLLRRRKEIEQVIHRYSARFGVRIYSLAVNADHIHLNVRITNRVLYRRWIRAITSRLVALIKGLKFALIPYSKIVSWGKQFNNLCEYHRLNRAHGDFLVECFLNVERWVQGAALNTGQWISLRSPDH